MCMDILNYVDAKAPPGLPGFTKVAYPSLIKPRTSVMLEDAATQGQNFFNFILFPLPSGVTFISFPD